MHQVKLTPPQSKLFVSDAKATAFVGGFGSGKSHALFTRLLATKIEFPKNNLGYFSPSYSLIKDIAYPRLEEMLNNLGARWRLNKSDNIISIAGYGNILFRSMEVPERIIGFEIMQAFVDEIDTLQLDHAENAWNKIIARTRQAPQTDVPHTFKGPLNKLFVGTTPEGYRFTYKKWKKEPPKGYTLIRAPTISNPHLPKDYVDTLRETYPAALIDAYLEGLFVNLTGNTVYSTFNRVDNDTNRTIQPNDVLHIGCDFNVNNMSAVVHVIDNGDPRAVAELVRLKDTPDLIKNIDQYVYAGHEVIVYPDASGKSTKTIEASKSDLQLLTDAGFTLRVPYMNPPIKDRVITMCAMFCNSKGIRRYLVNTKTCPEYTSALEQQIYLPNGLPEKNKNNNIDDLNDSGGYFIHYNYHVDRPKFKSMHINYY